MKKIKKSIVLIIVTLELICFGFMCTNTYAVTKNGWVKIKSDTYYYVNGKPVKGKYTVKEEPAGTYYFSKKTGKRLSGWRTINQNKYYFNPKMVTGWQTVNGYKYYMGADGVAKTGWQIINGKKYYFFKSDVKTPKTNYKGSMATYLNNIGGNWYYMDPTTGECKTGWMEFEGYKYYFDLNTYKAATGKTQINGKTYNFSSKGILEDNNYFNITLIDVGGASGVWGDMTLLESNGKYLLVDTGIKAATKVVKYLKDNKVKKLDIMISHYHRDHIGNLVKILKDPYFNVGKVYLPGTYKDNNYDYASVAKKQAKECVIMQEGSNVNFGCVKGNVIYLQGENDTNDGSAAVMFEGAGIKYFTAGDLEKTAENNIINRNIDIKADVFKFNHHAVTTASNQQKFLSKINAAIYVSNCCGDNSKTMNTWGKEAYVRAKKIGGMVLSSRYNGSFTLNAVGGHITIKCPRNSKTKTVKAFNVRTGVYENIKIKVNKDNNNIKSKVVLPMGYRLSK